VLRVRSEANSDEDQKLCNGGDRSIHLVVPPRDIALDDADEKREQRRRGATCSHRPAAEAKSDEDQKLCASGDRPIHLAAPLPDIALDDADEKREQQESRSDSDSPCGRPFRTRTKSSATGGIAPFIWLHHFRALPWTTRTRSASSGSRGETAAARVGGHLGRGPEALRRGGSPHSFGSTTSGNCLGRRGREARAAGVEERQRQPVCEAKSDEDQKLCGGGGRSIHFVAPLPTLPWTTRARSARGHVILRNGSMVQRGTEGGESR